MEHRKIIELTRRQMLASSAGAAATLGTAGRLALQQRRVLTLVRDAATNSMRAVEKVVWIAR